MKVKRTKYMYKKKRGWLTVLVVLLVLGALFAAGWFFSDEVLDFLNGTAQAGSSVSSSASVQSAAPSSPSSPSSPSFAASQVSQADPVSQPAQPTQPSQPSEVAVFDPSSVNAVTPYGQDIYTDEGLENFCINAAQNGADTVIIDVKDNYGYLLYTNVGYNYDTDTENGSYYRLAQKGANPDVDTRAQLSGVVKIIKDNGLFAVARINCFMDNVGGTVVKKSFVTFTDGTVWLDNSKALGGLRWLNPYSDSARQYNITVAQDCAYFGFDAVLLDFVQFPVGVGLYKADYGEEAKTVSRAKVLTEFVQSVINSCDIPVMLTVRNLTAAGSEEFGGSAFNYALTDLAGYVAIVNAPEVPRSEQPTATLPDEAVMAQLAAENGIVITAILDGTSGMIYTGSQCDNASQITQ